MFMISLAIEGTAAFHVSARASRVVGYLYILLSGSM